MFSEWSQAADSEKLSCVIAEAALPGQPVDVAAEDAWEAAVSGRFRKRLMDPGHPPNVGVAGFASERADAFAAAFASNTCFALRAAMWTWTAASS